MARSRPTRPLQALALATRASRSNLPSGRMGDHRRAACRARGCARVSARVSTPARPTTPRRSIQVVEVGVGAPVGRRGRQRRGRSRRAPPSRPSRTICSMSSTVRADIADVREGEGDDLGHVGGVGQDLLVAGHGGVEADLAHRLADRADADALQDGPVRQRQHAGARRAADRGSWRGTPLRANGGVGSESPRPGQCEHIARRDAQTEGASHDRRPTSIRTARPGTIFKALPQRPADPHAEPDPAEGRRPTIRPDHPDHGKDSRGLEAYRAYGRTTAPIFAARGRPPGLGRQAAGDGHRARRREPGTSPSSPNIRARRPSSTWSATPTIASTSCPPHRRASPTRACCGSTPLDPGRKLRRLGRKTREGRHFGRRDAGICA